MMSMAQIQVGWALRDIIKTVKITETNPKFDEIQHTQCVVHDRHIVKGVASRIEAIRWGIMIVVVVITIRRRRRRLL